MSVRTVATFTIFCLGTSISVSAQSPTEGDMNRKQSQTESHTRMRAAATVTVQGSEAKPYDQTESPTLLEVNIKETSTGDIEGESSVRALQIRPDDRSARMVSVQRVSGRLAGRKGTFVLHQRLPGQQLPVE
jgi:hypothetical protein